jgi:hypothetical protein
MVAKVVAGGAGSAGGVVSYLEKERPGEWFTHDREGLGPMEVTEALDANKRNLGQDDAKFYHVILAPSAAELDHIGRDPAQLQAFARDAMQAYAENFGKGLQSGDVLWYAKVEEERHHKGTDTAVQAGEARSGDPKPGPQAHVHVVVSRTERLDHFRAQQAETGRKTPYKLSPATNHQQTVTGPVRGGFSRVAFIQASERAFDQRFGYERAPEQAFQRPVVVERPAPVVARPAPPRAVDQSQGR